MPVKCYDVSDISSKVLSQTSQTIILNLIFLCMYNFIQVTEKSVVGHTHSLRSHLLLNSPVLLATSNATTNSTGYFKAA